jgi:hypothetical protein
MCVCVYLCVCFSEKLDSRPCTWGYAYICIHPGMILVGVDIN